MKNRYPGAKPFSASQQHIFFGRDQDIDTLYIQVQSEQLTVMHSKSGLGKSSLLNAGLIPLINNNTSFTSLNIRIGSWKEGQEESALDIVKENIWDQKQGSSLLDKIIPEEGSLWYTIKSRQIENKEQEFLLIFDQFEELFSFPEEEIIEFKKDLTELLHTDVPQRFRGILDVLSQGDFDILSDAEEKILFTPPKVKCLLAIRSDRLHLLDKLKDQIPEILQNTFELTALFEADAKEALEEPARMKGDFDVPPFEYNSKALNNILSFLKGEANKIESIQLQLLCQSFEEKALKENIKIFTPKSIGNLEDVISNFYNNKIANIGSTKEQIAARKLIEEGLVLEAEKMRLSLHEGQIAEFFDVPIVLLRKLVDTHLLRSEPSIRGGYNYELSHDTLINPVLEAKAERRKIEEKIAKEKELEKIRVAEKENLVKEKAKRKRTEETRIREQEKKQLALEKKMRRRTTALAWAGFALAILALSAMGFAFRQSKKANIAEANAIQAEIIASKSANEEERLKQLAEVKASEAKTAQENEKIEKEKAIQQSKELQKALNDLEKEKEKAVKKQKELEKALVNWQQEKIEKENYQDRLTTFSKNINNSITKISKQIIEQPNNAELLQQRAERYSEIGEYGKAVADYNIAITSLESLRSIDKVSLSNLYNNRGFIYMQSENFNKAIVDYNKAISLNPNSGQAYNNLGMVLLYNENYEEALEKFNFATKMYPNETMIMSNLSIAYSALGQEDKAINEITKAIQLAPNNWLFYANRADLYRLQNKHKKANIDASEAIRLNPDAGFPYGIIAILEGAKGSDQKFYQNMEKAVNFRNPFPLDRHYEKDPTLQKYRNQKRFKNMLRKFGIEE